MRIGCLEEIHAIGEMRQDLRLWSLWHRTYAKQIPLLHFASCQNPRPAFARGKLRPCFQRNHSRHRPDRIQLN